MTFRLVVIQKFCYHGNVTEQLLFFAPYHYWRGQAAIFAGYCEKQCRFPIVIFFVSQFVIYGSYFFIIGAVFLARAVFHMTRVGWRQCWEQRYNQEDQWLSLWQSLQTRNIKMEKKTNWFKPQINPPTKRQYDSIFLLLLSHVVNPTLHFLIPATQAILGFWE